MKKNIILMICCWLMAVSCSDVKESKVKAPVQVTTEVATVYAGDGSQNYVGIVEENKATAVSFTSMGVVKRMYVEEGQAVRRGQLIAEMDDTQARNMLSGAEAAMTQANDALKRYGMLHDNGSLPEVQWVEVQSKVAQAKSQLDIARKNLSDCRLVAPVAGIIGKKTVNAGETALPSQAVVSILDISTVKVKVSIPETEMNAIGRNTPSTISVEATGQQLNGGYIEKGVQADALTHTYDIRIHVGNPGHRLLPGMVADVTLGRSHAPAYTRQVALPITSVQKKTDGSLFIWTIAGDSTAHRTTVTIGHTQGNRVNITSGVAEGQRIVTEGYQKLSEGTKVIY